MRQQPLEIDKAQVLQAAMHDFGEYGFAYASLRRICEMGGFTPARLRRVYRSKEVLYVACVEAAYTQLSAHLQKFRTDAASDLETDLLRLYRVWLYFFRLHPEQIKVIIGARAVPPPGLQAKLGVIRQKALSANLQKILQNLVHTHISDDATGTALVTLLMSLLDDVILGSGLQKSDLYPENLETHLHEREQTFQKALHIWMRGWELESTAQTQAHAD